MKKTTLIFLVLALLSTPGFSQGFYIRAGIGYGMPLAGQTLDGNGVPYNGTSANDTILQTKTFSIKGASFSAGMQGILGLGYMFSKNVGVQMDLDAIFFAKEYQYRDVGVLADFGVGPVPCNVTYTQKAKKPMILTPSLVLRSGGKKLDIYSRFGLAIPLNTKMTYSEFIDIIPYTPTGARSSYEFQFNISNSFSLGLSAAAGVQYKLSDKVSIWGEASLLSMSVYIKQSDLSDFRHNGVSYSLNNVISPHTYYYSKNTSADTTGTHLPAYSQPFSNVSIKAGISINLKKRTRKVDGEGDNRERSSRPRPTKFK